MRRTTSSLSITAAVLLGIAGLSVHALEGQDGALRDEPVTIGTVAFTPAEVEHVLELSPLPDPPPDPTNAYYEDPRAAHFGRFLFFDQRLSGAGDVSCATCHIPSEGWADRHQQARATGMLERHTMTVWNVAYNRWFFWDGRADTLWSQALKPLETPVEHDTSRLAVVHLVGADADLRRAYEELFGPLPELTDSERFPSEGRPIPDEPEHPHAVAWASMTLEDQDAVNRVFANLGKSMAAFQRLIVSRHAPFDVFVEGLREGDLRKQRWLSDSARRGLKLFVGKARCHVCHDGAEFTDREFHNNLVPPLEGRVRTDPGRFLGIKQLEVDPFNGMGAYSDDPEGPIKTKIAYLRKSSHNVAEFKTASLRNVAVTPPYMHQGQLPDLESVVRYYSTLDDALPMHKGSEKILQPTNLTDAEVADLVAFLESLTDTDLPPELESPPETPWMPAR